MSLKKTIITAAVAVVFGLAGTASAQDLKTQGKKVLPNVSQLPNFDPARLKPNYAGGAAAWVSPILVNSPGTIGGEPYTIDGKRYIREFGFSIVNANGSQSVTANLICFNTSGVRIPRYNQNFTIPALGAANWESSSVTPSASTDGASRDYDEVWCAINADTPVFAFGWSELRFGQDTNRSNISLERSLTE